MERLQKAIAEAGVTSRRKAEQFLVLFFYYNIIALSV